MKFKTRLNNILAKIANEDGAKKINVKTKDETLLAEIENMIDPFVIAFSGTTPDGSASCNKTWNEIVEAYNAGRQIVSVYNTKTQSGSIITSDTHLGLNTETTLQFSDGAHLNSLKASGCVASLSDSTINVSFINCAIDSSGVTVSILSAGLTEK